MLATDGRSHGALAVSGLFVIESEATLCCSVARVLVTTAAAATSSSGGGFVRVLWPLLTVQLAAG